MLPTLLQRAPTPILAATLALSVPHLSDSWSCILAPSLLALPPLQGTLFHDRMSPEALTSVHAALVALEDSYLTAHPGAKISRAALPKPKAKGF